MWIKIYLTYTVCVYTHQPNIKTTDRWSGWYWSLCYSKLIWSGTFGSEHHQHSECCWCTSTPPHGSSALWQQYAPSRTMCRATPQKLFRSGSKERDRELLPSTCQTCAGKSLQLSLGGCSVFSCNLHWQIIELVSSPAEDVWGFGTQLHSEPQWRYKRGDKLLKSFGTEHLMEV